jgi:hypothetical protein
MNEYETVTYKTITTDPVMSMIQGKGIFFTVLIDYSWSMEGIIQQTRVAARVGYAIANSKKWPQYYAGQLEPFRQRRTVKR